MLSVAAAAFVSPTAVRRAAYTENEEAEGGADWRARFAAGAAPSDHFALVRAWPARVPDWGAMEQALAVARAQVSTATPGRSPAFVGTWRLEGPTNIGGRFNTIAVDPSNASIMYAGAAAGGVFKTIDGGQTWTPIFDDKPFLTIACITLQPGNPNVVYVGTGEPNIDQAARIGDGLYKSTDGGQTWALLGLTAAANVVKVVVHPTNSNVIYAATMGRPTARTPDRGLYKTTDGGQTWTKVLYLGDDAGVSDLEMHPTNPNILYATGWNRIRTNQESLISGPAAKLYKSIDGGQTWTTLWGTSRGLPDGDASRLGLAMARSNPQVLYLSVLDPATLDLQGLYRSADGGQSWVQVSATGLDPNPYNNFGWYFEQVYVSPTDPNEVFIGGVDLWKSTNGGTDFAMAGPPWFTYEVHADKHDLVWTSPTDVLLATDGGLYRSADGGNSWADIEETPTTQFYRVAVNPHVAGEYWGGAQDNGTTSGSAAAPNQWARVFGGDGFQPRFHPTDPQTFYVETQNGQLYSTQNGGLTMADETGGIDPADRRSWDMPYLLDPTDPATLLTGTYRVYRQTGAPGAGWTAISPDLTDGVIFGPRYHTISALDQSMVDPQHIWAGTSDGNVWLSLNGGQNWLNVTGTLPDRYVTRVVASPTAAGVAFTTHSGYKNNEFTAHVHKTSNNGQTWTSIAGDLPPVGVNALLVVPGTQDQALVAATDAGVYATRDGGAHWERVGTNMPVFPVYDVAIDAVNNRLIAGTFARSLQSIELSVATGLPGHGSVKQQAVSLYPNPARADGLRVSLPAGLRAAQVRVLDATGRRAGPPLLLAGTGFTVPTAALAPGAYVLEIAIERGALVRRRFVRE